MPSGKTVSPAPISDEQLPALLALNNANREMLSWLDMAALKELLETAFYAHQISTSLETSPVGMLIAFSQDADYTSPNFLWFRERYERFIYIDRVVIDTIKRGQKLANRLYRDLYQETRKGTYDLIVCEVNLLPANPASHAFHKNQGFENCGEAALEHAPDGTCLKKVAYYLKRL